MDQEAIAFRHCADMVALLSRTEGWGLSDGEADDLAAVATSHMPQGASDEQIRRLICNIRRDYAGVAALQEPGDPTHHQEWAAWLGQAIAILRHAHLDWSHDGAVDLDDLAQIALLELARSLPTFHYQSRFSTWAYQVIAGGVRRHLRDMSARKRRGHIDPSVDPADVERAIGAGDLPEAQVRAQILHTIVYSELTEAMGARNSAVFRLWASQDLSAEMIGQRVGLSVARVYAVIKRARQYLCARESLQSWVESVEG